MKTSLPSAPFRRLLLSLTLLVCLPAVGCDTTLFSEAYMNSLGANAYVDATKDYPLVTGTTEATMVNRIGSRIAQASGKKYEWEFKLLAAPKTVNAFCLPGGKIAVYSGLLGVTENEDALAAVVGHEVAHATMQHGNRRMSQAMMVQLGLVGAQVALSQWEKVDNDERAAIMAMLGVGVQVGVMLPYSRAHESEADVEGLRYLIRAGYDPYEAPKLWERMAARSPNRQPPFLSTHPDPLDRARTLRAIIPKIQAEEARRVAAPQRGSR